MSDIKPCPFCGSDDLEVSVVDQPSKSGWDSVECKSCCVEGMGWTVDDWNERYSDWKPINELPNSDETVLAKTKCGRFFTAYCFVGSLDDDGEREREWLCALTSRQFDEFGYELVEWKLLS